MSETMLFRKTWKRETAIALLAWLVSMVTWIVFSDPAAGVDLIKALIVPVIGLTAAMFGVQAYQNVSAAQYSPSPPVPPNTEAANNAPFRPSGPAPFRPNGVEDH